MMQGGDIVYSKERHQFGRVVFVSDNKVSVQYKGIAKPVIEDKATLRLIGAMLRMILEYLLDKFFPS